MSLNFIFEGKNYAVNKLDAKRQFHLIRKMLPAINENENGERDPLSAISKMSEEDADYCLFGLLECVKVEVDGVGFASISTDKSLMYKDMDLKTILALAGKSFMHNFTDFFQSLPSILEEAGAKVSNQ